MNDATLATAPRFLTLGELEAGLEQIRQAPKDHGVLDLIVSRPGTDQRQVREEARLDLVLGLEGDTWKSRGSSKTADGFANPETQLTLMNARVIALLAQSKTHWPLAGDQLFLDLDLSTANLPAGTKLAIGSAVIEVTPPPHTGCKKFEARFGPDATKFVNSPMGRELNLRGINAKILKPGLVRVGDSVTKV